MAVTTTDVDDAAARELLVDMVSIPSPSGEEDEAADRLVEFFETHDRAVSRDAVGNVRAPADDAVLLTSHVDTVPGDIDVRIEAPRDGEADGADQLLWGRGAVDATGSLVAMAAAAVRSGVSFAGVVQEETDSAGARHLAADREAPAALVNGEPSGWAGITLGYRGLLSGTYVATSESGHTSRPEANAIQSAIRWWATIEDRFPEDEWDPIFEQVTPKPVDVVGGTTEDGLSVETTMEVQFRIPPDWSADEIREVADGELPAGTVTWRDPIPPVMQSPRTPVARAFRRAIRGAGGEPTLLRKTGTSDMNVYAGQWDCPMATYGPGDSALDHAPNERLSLTEFDRSLGVLTAVAERLRSDSQ